MTKRPIDGYGTHKRVLFARNDGPLFNASRWYGFLYGCVGAVFFFVLYVLALCGRFYALTESKTAVLVIFCFHGVAGVLTFQQQYLRKWKPLLVVTSANVRAARFLFAAASLQFAAFFLVFAACGTGRQPLRIWLVPVILTSFLLQNTIYIAWHWALRPENFLPRRMIEAFIDPLGFIASWFH
jgi:hypothetical protein